MHPTSSDAFEPLHSRGLATPVPGPADLLDCVRDELALTTSFTGVLQDEARILADGAEPADLAAVTRKKNELTDALAKTAESRNALLQSLGHAHDREGLLSAAQTRPELADVIQRLFDQTVQASLLNQGNGQIIERFLNHHTQALNVLHHLTGRSQLYDARGRTRPTAGPRTGHSKRA